MTTDNFGLTISGTRPASVDAFNIYSRDLISYGPRVRSIFDAADADPDCCLVNAHAAAVHMALESASGFKSARKFVVRARALARDANDREREFTAAIYQWWRGNSDQALNRLREIVANHPSDIVTAKWAQYHAFNQGNAQAMLDVANRITVARPDVAEAWGMKAFALEQSNDISRAEQTARHALSLNRNEAWAQHAIAHVLDTQGRIDEGIEFLTSHAEGWADRSIFIREHNYWHLALFHLDHDDHLRALRVFDEHLWGEWPEYAQEQIGAISTLWRLELRGVSVGKRWSPVVEKVLERWHEHIVPFNDLLFIYALARGGKHQAVGEFLASLERRGEKDNSGVWDSLVIPCARGLAAYAQGRFSVAADALGPLLGRLHLVGGSHAQRDVFVQTWIDAALRAGQHSAVEDVVAHRARARPAVRESQRMVQRLSTAA